LTGLWVAAIFGSALLMREAFQDYPLLAALLQAQRIERYLHPQLGVRGRERHNVTRHKIYRERLRAYQKLYAALKGIVAQL